MVPFFVAKDPTRLSLPLSLSISGIMQRESRLAQASSEVNRKKRHPASKSGTRATIDQRRDQTRKIE